MSGDEQNGESGSELPDPLVVRLVDDAGDPVAGRAVAWVVATGEGIAAPETSDTDADGLASTRWTLGPEPGTNRLNAVVSGVGVVSFTATAVEAGRGRAPISPPSPRHRRSIEAGHRAGHDHRHRPRRTGRSDPGRDGHALRRPEVATPDPAVGADGPGRRGDRHAQLHRAGHEGRDRRGERLGVPSPRQPSVR